MELRKRNRRIEEVVQRVQRATEPIRSFDLYPKLKEDHKNGEKTAFGAAVSIAGAIVIFVLMCSEFSSYFTPTPVEEMKVDPSLAQRLIINMDITFHALHCGEVSLDAMDVAGEQQNGVAQDMVKTRLSAKGEVVEVGRRVTMELKPKSKDADHCGNCYGAESELYKCCNTCEDLIKAYEHKGWNTVGLGGTDQCKNTNIGLPGEGCHIKGTLDVNKVAGNIHFAMGVTHSRDGRHIHQFNPSEIPNFNVSHTIHQLSFGDATPDGQRDPLDGTKGIVEEATGVFQYYLQLVPVELRYKRFIGLLRASSSSYLYSVTSAFRPAMVNGVRQNVLPGVFFVYDFSPFMITREYHTLRFFEFVTGLFAILGGVLTVAGMVHSVGYHIIRNKHPLLSPSSSASAAGGAGAKSKSAD